MKDLIAKLHSDSADQILATFSTLEMQIQGFAKSSYEKDLRIAELEAQIAASADTDKLQEAIHKLQFEDAETDYKDGYNRGVRAAAKLVGSTALQAPVGDGIANDTEAVQAILDGNRLQAPVREVPEGMPVTQEPKYGIRDNRLFNRASGETIPEDEPVFIFRARDTHAVNILAGYAREVLNAEHASAVWGRVDDFKRFWDANPDLMKQPDTALPAAPVQEPKP